VYDVSRERLIAFKQAIFPTCFKITNITIQGGLIVLHTEKSLKVLAPDTYQTLYDFSGQSIDKIVHASLSSDGEGHQLSIITAHNFLEVWQLRASPSLVRRIFCEEECILYCADMNSTGLIASGTVFQSILIWREPAVI